LAGLVLFGKTITLENKKAFALIRTKAFFYLKYLLFIAL